MIATCHIAICNESGPCASCLALGPDNRGLAPATISVANSNDQSERRENSERRDFVENHVYKDCSVGGTYYLIRSEH